MRTHRRCWAGEAWATVEACETCVKGSAVGKRQQNGVQTLEVGFTVRGGGFGPRLATTHRNTIFAATAAPCAEHHHYDMGEDTTPFISDECTIEGADVATETCGKTDAPSRLGDKQNGSQKTSEDDRDATTGTSSNVDGDGGAEGSEAVRLLDEELVELEQLIALQRRKVNALERLRGQWISGERCGDNKICSAFFCVESFLSVVL